MKSRIWDIPLRLFHWALVVLVSVSLYTGLTGGFKEMDYHMLSGYSILALLLFRVAWGFMGTEHARFASFISIRGVLPHIRGLFSREQVESAGHNPLGALSVLAMLLSLSVQGVTGLFTDDDIMIEGPLTHLVSSETGDLMSQIHATNAWVLYVLIGLHLTAILFYELYKRQRLVIAMITGKKITGKKTAPGTDAVTFSILREVVVAALLMALAAGAIYYVVEFL